LRHLNNFDLFFPFPPNFILFYFFTFPLPHTCFFFWNEFFDQKHNLQKTKWAVWAAKFTCVNLADDPFFNKKIIQNNFLKFPWAAYH